MTDQYLHNIPEMTAARLAEIQRDPQVLTEYAMAYFDEVMNQPDLDPELAKDARGRKYSGVFGGLAPRTQAAHRPGLRGALHPSATSFDERLGRIRWCAADRPRTRAQASDMAMKAKVWEYTLHKEDFALGVNKAIVQTLQRDATVHLVEETLRPMTLTKQQVKDFAAAVLRPELGHGNIGDEISRATSEELGLTAVNFESTVRLQPAALGQGRGLPAPRPSCAPSSSSRRATPVCSG